MVALAVRDLAVTLAGRRVLGPLSFTAEGGALVGVIGPNGAGKSTLARAILGLVAGQGVRKDAVEGAVMVDGAPVGRIPRRQLARTIAYLPQGQVLHWPLAVERLVALGRLPHAAPLAAMRPHDIAAVGEAMRRTRVTALRARDATTLSGGERARVMLARALAVEAPVLVADEPLASLDPGHQIDVMELLRRQARAGALVLVVLHDLAIAARYCDRLILLHHGLVAADGIPAAVLTEEHVARVYGVRALIRMEGGVPLVLPLARLEEGNSESADSSPGPIRRPS